MESIDLKKLKLHFDGKNQNLKEIKSQLQWNREQFDFDNMSLIATYLENVIIELNARYHFK